jgi:hypothetical protein
MRWWLLSREEVIERAQRHVESQRPDWVERVKAGRRALGGWMVWTNAEHRGEPGSLILFFTRRGLFMGGSPELTNHD